MKKYKITQLYIVSFYLLACCLFACKAKQVASNAKQKVVWNPISLKEIKQSKDSLPFKFIAYNLDETELRNRLKMDSTHMKVIVELPLPDSSFVEYSLIEVQVMSPALAAKYPKFKTYEGVDVRNTANRVRVDFNDKNFHAYFMTSRGEFYIAPVDGNEKNFYIVFRKEDSPFPKMPFEEGKH